MTSKIKPQLFYIGRFLKNVGNLGSSTQIKIYDFIDRIYTTQNVTENVQMIFN